MIPFLLLPLHLLLRDYDVWWVVRWEGDRVHGCPSGEGGHLIDVCWPAETN